MGLLYDRFETEEHVIIRYSRFVAGVGAIISIMLLLTFWVQNLVISVLVYGLVLITIVRTMRPVRDELIAANKEGRVTRTGSYTSLRNPLTYYIKKGKPKGKRPGKGRPRGGKRRR